MLAELLPLVVDHERAQRGRAEAVCPHLVLDELLAEQLRESVAIVRARVRERLVHELHLGPVHLRRREEHDFRADALAELEDVVDPGEVRRDRQRARLLAGDAADHRREDEDHLGVPVEGRQEVDGLVDVGHQVARAAPRPDVDLENLVPVLAQPADERSADVPLGADDQGLHRPASKVARTYPATRSGAAWSSKYRAFAARTSSCRSLSARAFSITAWIFSYSLVGATDPSGGRWTPAST